MPLVADEVLTLPRDGGGYALHVPTSALFALDGVSMSVLEEALRSGPVDGLPWAQAHGRAVDEPVDAVLDAVAELRRLQLLRDDSRRDSEPSRRADAPPQGDSVANLVLHVAHTCNLGCGYCYAEQGLYKGRAELMTEARAREYVDWLFDQADPQAQKIALTFFGGEPLLNMPVVRAAAEHAMARSRAVGKPIRFGMTTNGTLVTEEIAEFLAAIGCTVTVSLDGVGEVNDRLRPFHSGKGSYDQIMSRIRPLLDRRMAVARVTVTRKNLDVVHTVEQLLAEGFEEVGCSPVDAKNPAFDLSGADYDVLLGHFRVLTRRYIDSAVKGQRYGFSNIANVVKAVHGGHNKDYPCGAGVQMVAGAPNGEMSLCHRFVGEKDYVLGRVQDGGLDQERRRDMLRVIHLDERTDCSSCWARYICSGGCHHVNFLFGGHPSKTFTHHCDWLRAWYKCGVEAYAEILERNPSFIQQHLDPGYLCGR